MSPKPEPPVNVRLVYADDPDTEIPVECVYLGIEIDRTRGRLERLSAWVAVNPRDEAPVRVLADVLPARTTIRVGTPGLGGRP